MTLTSVVVITWLISELALPQTSKIRELTRLLHESITPKEKSRGQEQFTWQLRRGILAARKYTYRSAANTRDSHPNYNPQSGIKEETRAQGYGGAPNDRSDGGNDREPVIFPCLLHPLSAKQRAKDGANGRRDYHHIRLELPLLLSEDGTLTQTESTACCCDTIHRLKIQW
jgi:hypothetical protein